MKKIIPFVVAAFVIYLIWCFIRPGITYHSIKRRVNDLHSQDAVTTKRIGSDQTIYDSIFTLAEDKGIYPEEIEVIIDRFESNRIRTITVHYTDYVLFFNIELIPRNYTYESETESIQRAL